jgi:hypothetical protein
VGAARVDQTGLNCARHARRSVGIRPREVTWRLIVGCTASKQQCFSGAEDVGVPATLTNDDVARRCADDLDAEAAYCRHRAVQEEQALGAGYYVDLLRGVATDRAVLAQRIRTGKPVPAEIR